MTKKEKANSDKPAKVKKEKAIPDINNLDSAQKLFIENRVKELGDLDSVKGVYKEQSSVCLYAWQVAEEMYK